MPKPSFIGASHEASCSRTMTLPIKTWAQLYELGNMKEKPLKYILETVINEEWKFQMDKRSYKEETLIKANFSNPNDVPKTPIPIRS